MITGSTPLLYLGDPAMQEHDPGDGHPEAPERLRAIHAQLWGLGSQASPQRPPPEVEREALLLVHEPAYVERLLALEGRSLRLDADTALSPGSLRAAKLAAGSAVAAVDALVRGEPRRAFSFVRPPGHHAVADRAMGFCVFNNVAIAAEVARRVHGLQRILIVDWDVHHGNGTESIFYDDPDVLFFSTHQFPFYPGTGAAKHQGSGAGQGFNVNVPLPAGSTNADLRLAFTEILRPIAQAFAPELVLVSAGFDAHRADPLGGMMLTEEGFADLCSDVLAIAEAHAGGRLALFLEGGYDLGALGRSVQACARVLEGVTPPDLRESPTAAGLSAVKAARDEHRRHWKCL